MVVMVVGRWPIGTLPHKHNLETLPTPSVHTINSHRERVRERQRVQTNIVKTPRSFVVEKHSQIPRAGTCTERETERETLEGTAPSGTK